MGVYLQDWMGLDGGTQKRQQFEQHDIIILCESCRYFLLCTRSKQATEIFRAAERRNFLREFSLYRVLWHYSKRCS